MDSYESNLMAAVLKKTGDVFGVPVGAILSKGRHAPVVRARHAAMYVLSIHFGQADASIAHFFSRDHASVSHAKRSINHALRNGFPEERERLKKRIEKLKETKDPDYTEVSKSDIEQILELRAGEACLVELRDMFKEISLLIRMVRERYDKAKMCGLGKEDKGRTLEARTAHHNKSDV